MYVPITEKSLIDRYQNIKQDMHESLTDYAKRFKQLRDALYHEVEMSPTDCFAMKHADYKNLTNDDLKREYLKKYQESVEAAHFIESSNHKYEQLRIDLSRAHALNNDLYPKTLQAAIEALSQYKIDRAPHKKIPPKTIVEEDKAKKTETSFYQTGKRCLCCGKRGHVSDDFYQI